MSISSLSSTALDALAWLNAQGRRPGLPQGTEPGRAAAPETTATLSPEAVAASRNTARPEGLQKLVDEARADPAFGRQYLGQLAGVTTDGPMVDLSHPPEIRLSSTGEIWTDEKQAQYSALSAHVMQQRRDLINAGLADGSAPDEVLQRVYAFNDALPRWYKDGMNWA